MGEKETGTGEALRESPTKASLGKSAEASADEAVPDGNDSAKRQHGDITIAKYSS